MFTNLEYKYPYNIGFIILAVAAACFFFLAFRKKEAIMRSLRFSYKARFKVIRTILLFTGLALMVFSLMGPQSFNGYTELQKNGMDIYFLIDTSKSMLVSDVKPDRISIAKKIVGDLLNNLDGDRIGFIPFASDAYIQMPLTDDYQLAQMFLDVVDTDMISGGGTNLASAIKFANASFDRTSGKAADRVIIIISDGEEHDDDGQAALRSIMEDGVRIYTIGIGTDKGGLVPIYGNDGITVVDYMKDENNNPVTSRLNANTLMMLAEEGNGVYYQAGSQGIEIPLLLNELSGLSRDIQTVEKVKSFVLLYQYFLAAGIFLVVTAYLIDRRLSFERRTTL